MTGIEKEQLCREIDAAVPQDVTHIGMVLSDIRGNIVIRRPEKPKAGVTATWPRWKRKGAEPSATLKRCLTEHVGIEVASVYPLHRVWITENSSTLYFVGVASSADVTPAMRGSEVKWYSRDDAACVLHSSENATTRNRDLAVLRDSGSLIPSSFRRVLLVVSELHRMGFGRLRAATWMHQNGYIEPPGQWSCSIVPTAVLQNDHGALTNGDRVNDLRSALGVIQHHDPWTSHGMQPPFGWTGMCFESPRAVAEAFAERFRELCFIGWGSDLPYQRWFEEMLSATAPYGVFYPLINERDYVLTAYTAVSDCRLPAPPLPHL